MKVGDEFKNIRIYNAVILTLINPKLNCIQSNINLCVYFNLCVFIVVCK